MEASSSSPSYDAFELEPWEEKQGETLVREKTHEEFLVSSLPCAAYLLFL